MDIKKIDSVFIENNCCNVMGCRDQIKAAFVALEAENAKLKAKIENALELSFATDEVDLDDFSLSDIARVNNCLLNIHAELAGEA
jgi:hypothetical protein